MRSAITLIVALAIFTIGCRNAVSDGPIVVVTASYHGASAQAVVDTVGAPIEQQIIGVENMVRLESESSNDGSYKACVRFKANTDPDQALMLVENRVALAKPVWPEPVQRAGVSVKVTKAEDKKKEVTIAILDCGNNGWDALRKFSEAALKRITADAAILKPDVSPRLDGKQVNVNIDRDKCAKFGISFNEVMKAMDAAKPGKKIDEMKALRLHSPQGDTITLGEIAAFDLVSAPNVVYRIDMYQAVRITGLPPAGKTTESAAARCAELAEAERKIQHNPAGFRVINLTER